MKTNPCENWSLRDVSSHKDVHTFLIAVSTLSFGIMACFALLSAAAKRPFTLASAPPALMADTISREILEKSLPRFASLAPLVCLTLLHLL